jgi:hypothetical protein
MQRSPATDWVMSALHCKTVPNPKDSLWFGISPVMGLVDNCTKSHKSPLTGMRAEVYG